jgi:hypothetical protein
MLLATSPIRGRSFADSKEYCLRGKISSFRLNAAGYILPPSCSWSPCSSFSSAGVRASRLVLRAHEHAARRSSGLWRCWR